MPDTKGRTTVPGKASPGKALKPRPKKGAAAVRAPGAARAEARVKAEAEAATPPTAPRVQAVKKAAFAGYEDFAELGAGNIKAVFDSGKIFAQGMETLGEEMATYARDSFEAGMEVARGLGECKSLTEALDRQSAFARSSFDKFVAQAAKLSDMSAKVARDSLEPINARVNAAAERFIKTVTA